MADLYQFEPMLGPAEEFPPGSVEWAMRISNRLQTGTKFISRHTARHVGETLKQIWESSPPPWKVWPEDRPFRTPDDYFRAVTGYEWKALQTVIAEVIPEHKLNVTLARAQAEHRSQGTRTDQLPYDVRKSSERGGDGGNSAAYLLRRLARDRPDILAAYERGEFKSARAAAKAGGIIKEKSTLQKILALLPELTDAERVELRAELHKQAKDRAA